MQTAQGFIIVFLVIGAFFLQFQLNKMDRKLTCIYNIVNGSQMELTDSSCDKGYIFFGFHI